uniref:Protein kinase domain-containing protein n=1 Tax=Sinocyclocheilus rhinocerous TaxID=307959 RepID=A0A673LD86_9TELE
MTKNSNGISQVFISCFRYDIKALIGCGSFSRVVRAEHRRTRQPFAIKLLEVKGREGHEACQAELRVLRRVNHSNVISLAEVFETQHRVYLVLELATGGELLERVVARGTFRERDATKALMMVSSGLRYLHTLGIIHRDLKPENLLYYHPGQDSRLIITDFGLAYVEKSCQAKDWAVRTLCGTPEYLAPEMLARRPCSSAVDMWALGVITYILLSGSLPFDQSSRPRLFRAILRGSYSFHGDVTTSITSHFSKDFLLFICVCLFVCYLIVIIGCNIYKIIIRYLFFQNYNFLLVNIYVLFCFVLLLCCFVFVCFVFLFCFVLLERKKVHSK